MNNVLYFSLNNLQYYLIYNLIKRQKMNNKKLSSTNYGEDNSKV